VKATAISLRYIEEKGFDEKFGSKSNQRARNLSRCAQQSVVMVTTVNTI
jgi:hypothetical protein